MNNLFAKKNVAEILGVTSEELSKYYESEFITFQEILDLAYKIDTADSDNFKYWVSERMSKYLNQGFLINEEKFQEIQKAEGRKFEDLIKLMQKYVDLPTLEGKEVDLFTLIEDYSESWNIFHLYDENKLSKSETNTPVKYILTYEEAQHLVQKFTEEMSKRGITNDIFAREVNNKLKIIIECLWQKFGDFEFYRGIEEKAANLLYLIIKDHAFVDGNKRIASMLFVYFLEKNGFAWKASNERKLNDNALVALSLLVAASEPREKDQIIALIVRLLQNDKL